MLTPVFLTKEIAKKAVHYIEEIIHDMDDVLLPHIMCHILILVPSMKPARDKDFPYWPNYKIEPYMLYEHSIGNPKKWPHNFSGIAKSKALQLWHERNDDRTDCMPHLLLPGETPFWGGVKRHGIVVSCSGFQPYFDKMFSGLVADMCIGLTYNAWIKAKANIDEDFLPDPCYSVKIEKTH